MRILLGSLIVLTSLLSHQAIAKPFKTEFISMELPPGWDCVKEEIDWVCQPENLAQRSEAIVIVVVKSLNEIDDTFEKYQAVLEEPRDMRDMGGNLYKSKKIYVRFKEIKGHRWIDAMHQGSEMPGFQTRYVASMKGKVAGLVSYSIAESVYAKWAPILDAMIDSLELRFDPKAFNDAMNANPGSLLGQRSNALKGRFAPVSEDESKEAPEDSGFDLGMVAGGILLLGAVAYFIWKKKQQS